MKKGSEMKIRGVLHFSSSFTLAFRVQFLSWVYLARDPRESNSGRNERGVEGCVVLFSRRSSCSSYSLPRERASIRKDRDKPRVKERKREEKREDTGCHEMRCDTLGCSSRGSHLLGEQENCRTA